MQGFIVHINRVKDEDLIVTILTEDKLLPTYRFYGARHSVINTGYMIDFETELSSRSNLAQLRHVMHLAQNWNLDRDRFYFWQSFVKLFYEHLRDVENVDKFYFDLLKSSSEKWYRQNPKRVAVEAYLNLLQFEGRLHSLEYCFLCEEKIEEESVALARAYLPAHTECIHNKGIHIDKLKQLFHKKKTLFLDDDEAEYLYRIMNEGF
ncbi:MAG: recombination protein RecO [Campylobacteraceae bacterium]|nr:recombination protein RecO [Campylobacteraceae bacterium]